MKVWFGQIYSEPGVAFPFSHHCQKRLSREVSSLVNPSAKFIDLYGKNFEIMFRVSAKLSITDNEIIGPAVFKKTKDVEYSVFLPFNQIIRHIDAPRIALKFLLKGVSDIFDSLNIDNAKLVQNQDSIIEGICSDPKMLEEPSWDEAQNNTPVRAIFESFFRHKKH